LKQSHFLAGVISRLALLLLFTNSDVKIRRFTIMVEV
jgi:hypothetical protein